MKSIILIIFLFMLSSPIFSQDHYRVRLWAYTPSNVVTDSVVWKVIDVDSSNMGKKDCTHYWIYSDTHRAGPMGCGVFHNGWHCSYDDLIRNRICNKCLKKETEREFWYQSAASERDTEYKKLEKKLNSKDIGKTVVEADTISDKVMYHRWKLVKEQEMKE